MIIMLRIIVVLVTLTLTACDAPRQDTDADGNPPGTGAAAGAAAAPGRSPAGSGNGGAAAAPDERGAILFIGTSLTAGYGLGEHVAYPAVIQQKIDSAGLPFRVVNAGISGETSAGGLRRVDWALQRPVEVLVLELGANDGLRALPTAALRDNLDEILRRARARYPDVAIIIAGMHAPPNLGEAYTTSFRRVFADLARDYDAALVPFLLEGVAALPALNLEDGIHPNAEGHRVVAHNVWAVLAPVLHARATQRPSSD
jgi:acyl-CoA thioesterase I